MRFTFFSLIILAVVGCSPHKKAELIQLPSSKYVPNAQTRVDSSAHWINKETLLVKTPENNVSYFLAILDTDSTSLNILDSVKLYANDSSENSTTTPPHLSSYYSFAIKDNFDRLKPWLKEKLAVVAISGDEVKHIAYVQFAELLDTVYANQINDHQSLGARVSSKDISIKLWAPTAKNVEMLLFDRNMEPVDSAHTVLSEDEKTGLWSTTLPLGNVGYYYQYQISVYHPKSQKIEQFVTTDPYSLSLSTNSRHSQIIDLKQQNTQPSGWEVQLDNRIAFPEDNIFYETHIRDFSFAEQHLSQESNRGKYAAFSEKNSEGIKHLRALRTAGINNIHLLPAFDIGTVNEQNAIDLNSNLTEVCALKPTISVCTIELNKQLTLKEVLQSFDPLSANAQHLVTEIKTIDKYNWGYDPFHYTVPEGSYAKQPNGVSRIVEFRQMVQSLHNLGFRVIMDVVYNHTHQAGLEPTAVLDKIVPNYYHRLNPVSGLIEQSTCCDNTATERKMMEKLMIDSLVVWARDYKIDGFRFDLMAHQPKSTMLKARKAVQAVDEDTYFYGEGWNFGEVASNQQFIQASQLELAGTEIGTFTDRLRDAVRGGAFTAAGEDIRRSQGIGNGLATLNNELANEQRSIEKYTLFADQLRVGLAGNLSNFPLINAQGRNVLGKDIPYGNQPTGYALDPADTINYVSKHDNQTLWDNHQYRLPYSLSTEDRVRLHLQSLAYPLFAQGIPFIHMGSELLRSKSYLRDSYDYSDWFNVVDFSMYSNNYNVGLPPAEKDKQNWSMIETVINSNQDRDIVTREDILFSKNSFLDMIKIRMSSRLFRLTSGKQVIDRVKFHNSGENQKIGLIAMSISDVGFTNVLDKELEQVMVIFNTSNENQTLDYTGAEKFQLHPIQVNGSDERVKTSRILQQSFVVPPLSTAVFIKTAEL